MPSEYLFDDEPDRRSFITPDEDGFTLRTQFKGTHDVLDQNAKLRNAQGKTFTDKDGVHWYPVMAVPPEILELWYHRLGRFPTVEEMLKFGSEREFNKVKTKDARLV